MSNFQLQLPPNSVPSETTYSKRVSPKNVESIASNRRGLQLWSRAKDVGSGRHFVQFGFKV